VEARRAAEDTRLERFRADDVPFNTSRALATFATVAAPVSDAPDSLITGIDIRV
jgi:DNA-binding IclR family transcriptional regulator